MEKGESRCDGREDAMCSDICVSLKWLQGVS